MTEHIIHVGTTPIILEHDDLEGRINVDDLTLTDATNLFGEAVTVSAAANRVGLVKADAESLLSAIKLEIKFFEGNFKANLRRQAAENKGMYKMTVDGETFLVKLTEKSLESSFETDTKWIKLKKAYIKIEREFNQLSSLYWSLQDKCRKFNGSLVISTTPEEFVGQIVESRINGILVTKK